MFASKTPRDLNHDPYPNVWDGHTEFNQMRADTHRFRKGAPGIRIGTMNYRSRPRPEFDHIQHNEPNPILVTFRKSLQEDLPFTNPGNWAANLAKPPYPDSWYYASPEQIDHARRVLTRLAQIGDR